MIDICEVLRDSLTRNASDVYLKVGIPPRMRRDGTVLTMDFPAVLSSDVLDCVLKLMDEQQREKLEETGAFCFSCDIPSAGRYRVSVFKSRNTVSMVFHKVWPIEDIVKDFKVPESVMELADIESGLVVFAGESGSGRTCGMAALVDAINEYYPMHVMTMENPIEVIHESKKSLIDQREAGSDYLDAVYGLQCAEKQAVDVLVFEDVMSAETMERICQMAETGKRVILSANGTSMQEIMDGFTNFFSASEQNAIRKRLSKILQAVVISRREGTLAAHSYEVIRVNAAMRNQICYGK